MDIKQVEHNKAAVSTLVPGTTLINGEGNLCMVMRRSQEHTERGVVPLINLHHGGHYTVKESCEHTPVKATTTWSYY